MCPALHCAAACRYELQLDRVGGAGRDGNEQGDRLQPQGLEPVVEEVCGRDTRGGRTEHGQVEGREQDRPAPPGPAGPGRGAQPSVSSRERRWVTSM